MSKLVPSVAITLALSVALAGCEAINSAAESSQSYLSSLAEQNTPEEIAPIEVYQHPEYGSSVRFASLPLDQAIVRVQGTGEHKMAVMMDGHCPYSRDLESRLSGLEDTTTYIFVGPFLQQSPIDLAIQQNCQANNQARLEAYETVMHDRQHPKRTSVSPACKTTSYAVFNALLDAVNGNVGIDKGEKIGGVPNIFLENDITLSGAASLDTIRKYRAM